MANKKLYKTQASAVLWCFAEHEIAATMQECAIVADAIEQGHAFEINGLEFQPVQTMQFGKFSVNDARP